MDLVDLIESRQFLGSEFLMWLWFRVDCFDGLLDVGEQGKVEVVFDDQLTLDAYLAETQRNVLRGGAPAYSMEALTALRHGKRATRAKLRLLKEGREWAFTFKAETADITGVKLPALLTQETDEQFYERMYLVEELEAVITELYRQFLEVRLSADWGARFLGAMKGWIESDEDPRPEDYPAS